MRRTITFDPDKWHRRSVRLQGYNYAQAGAYFVTICTQQRECLFGEVVEGEMRLNGFGEIAQACWYTIPKHFSKVMLDAFVVMPNHVHGILFIVVKTTTANVGATHASPLPKARQRPSGPTRESTGAIVGSYKSAVTKRIGESRRTPGIPVWQRNYHEHIIRDENELHSLRQYITDNPLQWALDEENPSKQKDMRF